MADNSLQHFLLFLSCNLGLCVVLHYHEDFVCFMIHMCHCLNQISHIPVHDYSTHCFVYLQVVIMDTFVFNSFVIICLKRSQKSLFIWVSALSMQYLLHHTCNFDNTESLGINYLFVLWLFHDSVNWCPIALNVTVISDELERSKGSVCRLFWTAALVYAGRDYVRSSDQSCFENRH